MVDKPDAPLDLDIPDLDTSAVRPRPRSGEPESGPRASGPTERASFDTDDLSVALGGGGSVADSYFGKGSFDADDFEHGGSIALGGADQSFDLLGVGALSDAGASGPTAIELGSGPERVRGVTAGGRAWPTGCSPDRGSFGFEPLALEQLAGYGPAPAGLHLAPLYAWRVHSGRRALRARLLELDRSLSEAERQRDDLLGALASEQRALLAGDARFEQLLAPLSELDKSAAEQSHALAAASAKLAHEAAAIEAQKRDLRREIEARTQELARAEAVVVERQSDVQRAEARIKRAFIEMRSVEQVARQGLPPGAPLPPEHVARMAELSAQAARLEPELTELRRALEQASAVRRTAHDAIAELGRRVAELDNQRAALERRFRPELAARSHSAGAADERRRQALADLGRALLAARGAVPVADSTLDAIARADAEVERCARDAEMHLRALDACDGDVVTRGRNLALAAAGAMVLLLLLLVLL